jgi:hypothetical protein
VKRLVKGGEFARGGRVNSPQVVERRVISKNLRGEFGSGRWRESPTKVVGSWRKIGRIVFKVDQS